MNEADRQHVADGNVTDILLVEDDSHDADLILRAMKHAGHETAVAWYRDGARALDFLRRSTRCEVWPNSLPRLIVLDLHMPRVSGIELAKAIKSDSVLANIPVVIFTSSDDHEDIVASYRNGANSYVLKPTLFDDLATAVARLVDYWLTVNRGGQPSWRGR